MSRLLVLGMLPLAALSASKGAMGADALSVATKAKPSHGIKPASFAPRNKDEQNNGGQRLRGVGWWSAANAQNEDTGLLQARDLQATGCGDGIAGVRSSGGDGFICCVEECGVCGGEGCSSAAGDGFDGSHCCVSSIASSGRLCSETGEAPCIMEEAEGCGNGIAGVRSEDGTGDVCCSEECGVCGGAGCASAAGEGFDNTHCCVSAILAAGQTCDETGAAPCLLGGVPGDKDGDGGIDGFAFRGCYLVEGSNPFSEITEDGAMTPELCFDTCARKSSLYMGLLKGNECGCGEDPSFLATDQADGVCDEPCPGDEVQTCGGALAYDLFELMDDDTTDDNVDEDTDDAERTSPDGNDMTGFLHVGCYAETSFDPFTFVTQINFMTIRLCSERCGSMGADYAGLMDGDVCGCGSEAGYIEADKEDGECLVECAGDDGRTEICGGETSFVLIQIIYSGMAIVTNAGNAIAAPTPTPSPELIAQLNSDAAGAVIAAPADAPAGSDASVLTAYTHLGCFGFEVENNPFFSLVQMDGMTYHTCSEACGALGAVYIGAFDGDMCGCGSKEGYLLEQKPAGTCDALCVGEATGDAETCGGSVSFDLLLINYLATEDDYFGPDSATITPGISTSGGLEEGSVPQSDGDTTDDVDSTTDFETGQVQTVVAPMAGYEYAGCFEMEPTLDPFSSLVQMDSMTIDTCTAFCGASGATYAAVMNGDMCGCGSDDGYLASDKEAGLCLVECAGDGAQVEMCGGSSSFGLFEIIYVAEDGTSDASDSSAAPASAYGLVFANEEMTGYIYEGCYQIDASFDPFSSLSQIDAMTPRSCNEMCGSLGADYAGAMDGDLCGCGNADNYLEAEKEDGECFMECTGDDGRTEMCGGSAAFDLYRIFYSESDDAARR